MSTFHSVGHGFLADDPIYFSDLVGGTGLVDGQLYYVLASGLTADDFKVAETVGGAEVNFTDNITSGVAVPWPVYTLVVDGNMDPPDVPATPASVTLDSDLVNSIVRLKVTL